MPNRRRIVACRSWTWTTSSHGAVAEFVGRAVGDAALDAAAGQPDREALDVMVAAVALGHRRPAELAAPDHQRLVEHAALLQVLDQRGRALIDLRGRPLDVLLDAAVMVPVAVVELDEPHAALGQPPGQQAVGRERAVAALRCRTGRRMCLRLVATGRSAPARWSASGTPSRRRRSAWRSPDRRRPRSRSDRAPGRHRPRRAGGRRCVPLGSAHVEHRVALGVEPDALEPAGQEAAVPLPRGDRLRLAELAVGGQHDEAGQIVALAAQAVGDPRAHRRPAGDGRAGVHEGVGRVVVDRLGAPSSG